jgi:hypothetical protein
VENIRLKITFIQKETQIEQHINFVKKQL